MGFASKKSENKTREWNGMERGSNLNSADNPINKKKTEVIQCKRSFIKVFIVFLKAGWSVQI